MMSYILRCDQYAQRLIPYLQQYEDYIKTANYKYAESLYTLNISPDFNRLKQVLLHPIPNDPRSSCKDIYLDNVYPSVIYITLTGDLGDTLFKCILLQKK